MRNSIDRRQFARYACIAGAVRTSGVVLPFFAFDAAGAGPAAGSDGAMIDFDSVYIPPLFLTGAAGKRAAGPAQASAALARLLAQWPALRSRLLAAWPGDAGWRRTLDAVQVHLSEADRQTARSAWPEAHEALEQVRAMLKTAREARGMDYALDRFVAFHAPMEHLAAAATQWTPAALDAAKRERIEHFYVEARVRWRAVEALALNASALRLTPARETQLRNAMAEEAAALAMLSQALRGDNAAALLQAAAATKPPFVRAYTAFGLAPGDALPG